jgi:hypothetical protein
VTKFLALLSLIFVVSSLDLASSVFLESINFVDSRDKIPGTGVERLKYCTGFSFLFDSS